MILVKTAKHPKLLITTNLIHHLHQVVSLRFYHIIEFVINHILIVLLKVPPKAKDAEVKEITTSLGQPTTLFAESPYADQSEIIWKKDGEPINHLILSDGSLYINDTGLSDQGDYTVTVTGTDDATSEIIRLTVINPLMPTC